MSLSEDELTRDDFEQSFLYEKVALFIKPSTNLTPVAILDSEGTQKPNKSVVEEVKSPISTTSLEPDESE